MNKINKDEWYMNISETVSERASCLRCKVGSVLVKDWIIISTWINWNARWELDCINKWCTLKDWHCVSTIHSELNCILNCARIWVSTLWTILYCTYKPCDNCSRIIINAWISKVFYKNDYKWDYTIKLEDYIEVIKLV